MQDYGALERGGDSPDGGADIDRRGLPHQPPHPHTLITADRILSHHTNRVSLLPPPRAESHPLRVHARDAKVCLTVFFVVCAVFLAAGILRSLGWGDDVVEEPAFGVRAAAYV